MLACSNPNSGRGRHASKTHLSLDACWRRRSRCPAPALRARPRQADRRVRARPAAVGADRAHLRHARGAGFAAPRASPIRRSIARTISPIRASLSRARVTVERTPNGDAVLRVTSPTPVNEPYLDLLVEVNWASGRVVRDYTFLLDPPGMPAPTPPSSRSRRRASARHRRRAPRAAAGRAGARAARAGASAAAPATATRVRRGDTLSKIAGEVQAAEGDARADAGRAVQRATRTRSTATT